MSRVLASLCPACGAPVRFTADSTVVAVCAYCASTLLRKGDAVENLGKMAELFEDHSPLQPGVRGVLDGAAFMVVGRLQYRYDQGMWNEWWLRFDDDERSLWLSEDNGQYVVTRAVTAQTVPPFEELAPGRELRLLGVDYTVASRARAKVVAGQGELPFVVGSGYDADVVDLRDPTGSFATLDFADFLAGAGSGPTQAMLYVGRAVTLDSLQLDGLRETLERTVGTEPFSCPNCGSPVQATLTAIRSITCPSCASVIDLSAGVGGRFSFARQAARVKPTIAVGSTGRLGDTTWTVVGFQRRRGEVDEETFEWNEYLLHDARQGFRFLVEDNGHWSFARVLQRQVTTKTGAWQRPVAVLGGVEYDHFADYKASVTYVEGEFYWQVKQGDRTANAEFIAPPRGLSRETSGDEMSWSESRYLAAAEVAAAFRLNALPPASGFGMLQPAAADAWRPRYRSMALLVLVALIGLQIFLALSGSERTLVSERPLKLDDPMGAEHLIEIDGRREANLVIATEGGVRNDWYEIEVEIADRNRPGEVRQASQEVSYYEGTDSDGAWTEGSTRDRLVFKLPPGQYLVRVSGERNPLSRQQTVATYSIRRSSRPTWLPFWIGLGFLVVVNAVGYLGVPDPEARRWSDSLYGRPPPRRRRPSLPAAKPA